MLVIQLGDMLFLKGLRYWYKTNPIESMTRLKSHFYEFKNKDIDRLGVYFYY